MTCQMSKSFEGTWKGERKKESSNFPLFRRERRTRRGWRCQSSPKGNQCGVLPVRLREGERQPVLLLNATIEIRGLQGTERTIRERDHTQRSLIKGARKTSKDDER